MTETVSKTEYVPTSNVRQAVQDAQRLLVYAVQSSLQLDDQVVKTVTRAKNILRQNAWTPEEEVEFWQAYIKLSATVKPVTIRSLKAVLPHPDASSWSRTFTHARVLIQCYRILIDIIVLLLLLLQVYWLFGADLLNKINELSTKQPQVDNQLKASYDGLRNWSVYWQYVLFRRGSFEGKNVLLDEQLIQEKISRLERTLETDKRLLANVEETQYAAIRQRIETNRQEQARLQRKLHEERLLYQSILIKFPSEFVLEILQSYILPMLYGLLGAAIFVLRSVIKEIEEVTYTLGSDIRNLLRLVLGALGGLAIGWFLTPDELSGFQVVSPLALALLVGYNIELLFAVMDGFIEAVSKSSMQPVHETTP